jgi:hypothetical protein
MIRLTNPNEHEVHITDPRTKIAVCVSPEKSVRVKSKVYEVMIEENELKLFDQFIRLKMLKGERVLEVKSNAAPAVVVDEKVGDKPVLVLSSEAGKSVVASAVAAAHQATAGASVAAPAVPARKVNGPVPGEAEKKLAAPAIPRRKS